MSLAEALYPNAGTLLFGNDINKLAADSADISRNLQKNLASRQPSTQNYSTGASNFQKYQPKNKKISPINPRNEQIRPWGEQGQVSPTRQPTTALSEQELRFPLTGRLRFFYNNWKKITLDPSILDIVLGYKIVFQTHPFQLTVPRSTTQNPCLIDKEVKCLLNKSAIVQVPYSKHAFYHRLFLVEKKNGGYRPVLDLSPLNTFIETTHFKMEILATLKSLINPGDYMINVDLTDASLSVPIHQESQKFLRLIWQNKAYQFKAMPFGLNM